ncbi:phosphoenolpyruvate synthase, partial [mine drainage metagenome]
MTTEAYQAFVDSTSLGRRIQEEMGRVDIQHPEEVERICAAIRSAFESTPFPPELRHEITGAYEQFAQKNAVRYSAVRSSATAEDLEGASFAGLQDTYLNITGTEAILTAIRRCWGSLFTPRVVMYRTQKGFDHRSVRLAVLVQKMVDARVSGILFTRDPNTGENRIIIEAGWGLGEAIVGGEVTPDHYVIDGQTQRLIHKQIAEQKIRLVRQPSGGNRREDVPTAERSIQKLSDDRIARLVSLARVIESHYRRPMDIEWCADADSIYIVQARPVTTIPAASESPTKAAPTTDGTAVDESPLVQGFGASPGIAGGVARILEGPSEMAKLRQGEILVTSMTTPDMVPAMAR